MNPQKKAKSYAQQIAHALIDNHGPMFAEQYTDEMLCEVEPDAKHDEGFPLLTMWTEVKAEVKKWEMSR